MSEHEIYNFYAGPATLPKEVLLTAQSELVNYRGTGFSIIETSHRSAGFEEVIDRAEANIRKLLGIGDAYSVLFLQGGASLQFAMVPMNLMLDGKPALYADTGSWANKAIKEAKLLGPTKVVFDGAENDYTQIGDVSEWEVSPDASYMYVCSNNTIFGTQYHFFPETGAVPLIADMSSDILSRRVDVNQFGLIFAGAQKNLGPAGVTVVIIRKDLADRVKKTVPTLLKYSTHIDKGSMYNTPPCFAVYIVALVTDWLLAQGGLEQMEKVNAAKSDALYECIDESMFYQGTVEPGDRSKMNVCFRLPEEELEGKFVKEAQAAGLVGLKGHRSVGGMRASIYNAMPLAGVSALIDFMHEFEARNG